MAELDASGVKTIRQAVSTVRESLRSINLDDRISNRHIFSIMSGYAKTFIEQDNKRRELFQQAHLFRTIECFQLEERDLSDACDIFLVSCKKVMRSINKIPKFYVSSNGTLLSVTSVFNDKRYDYIEPTSYNDYANREFKSKKSGVYWIHNEYLVIPITEDEFTDTVQLRGMFVNEDEVKKLNGEITATSIGGSCTGVMDQVWVVPEHLMGNILKYTIADIRNITVPLQEDAVPNTNQAERQTQIDGQ